MIVKVRDAVFAGVFPHLSARLPQYAFAGRSNVGKSSLINKLLGRKSLVRTSKAPGKTRAVNLFQVDLVDLRSIYLVDLPGYGYAKVLRTMSRQWGELAEQYFSNNADLRLVMLLVDIRRDLQDEEFMLIDLIARTPARVVLVATKTDKLSFSQRLERSGELARQSALMPVMTSAYTGVGMDELWGNIIDTLRQG